jgi:D-alanyl-D-alanine carboxypeptidase
MMRLLATTFEVAKNDPTMLADANAPWKGGKGPEGELFRADPGGDENLLLAALDPKSKSGPKSRTSAPVLVAELKDKPAVTANAPAVEILPAPSVMPILKPAISTPQDTQDASVIPVLRHDTPVIEALQHDPQELPPLGLEPAPALRIADSSAPLAQGDSAGAPYVPSVSVAKQANSGPVKRWAVQIGAFASEALAQARLAAFARRGFDIIGQAEKLIVPVASRNGRILYRARLGMFAESDARDICRRMLQRGQTCFAAPAEAG